MLTSDVNTLKKSKHEKDEAEKDLREALNTQRDELRELQRQLAEREQQAARGVLELECEPTRELNCEAQDSGRQLQRNAEEFGDSAIEPKRAEPLEGREECLSDIFQDALERMSALQKENEEMLESTKHERKPNDSATRQFNELKARGSDEALKRRMTKRRSELNNLEARLHDLRALKEEVALQHHLPEAERNQITEYLERDMKRCEEEIDIMRPPSPLAGLPEELIQVLMHMAEEGLPSEFDNGISPMHWAAQRGRRDLIEFIRQQI
ncbi:unnamed protein product, partial [Durusdinium trenchii]